MTAQLPRLLLTPDSFKGTLTAQAVAAALADGARAAGASATELPLADGGEGTTLVLQTVLGGTLHMRTVCGPLGDPVVGSFLLTHDGTTAVLDTATASGLHLVSPEERDAERATSRGTGELIAAAAAAGATSILVGVGGSACTDGGKGALAAICDAGGLRGAKLTVLCDVTSPFEDAPAVYAPQKGADAATVRRLEARLHALAESFPRDPRGVARTGAAGGLSGGLWAVHQAELASGIDTVLDLVDFDDLAAAADAIITGEGRLDAQTAHGKVVAGVTRRANTLGTPVFAVVGCLDLDPSSVSGLGLSEAFEAGTEARISAAAGHVAGIIQSQHRETP